MPHTARQIRHNSRKLRRLVQPIRAKHGQVQLQGSGELLDHRLVENLTDNKRSPRHPLLLTGENRRKCHEQGGFPLQHNPRAHTSLTLRRR